MLVARFPFLNEEAPQQLRRARGIPVILAADRGAARDRVPALVPRGSETVARGLWQRDPNQPAGNGGATSSAIVGITSVGPVCLLAENALQK